MELRVLLYTDFIAEVFGRYKSMSQGRELDRNEGAKLGAVLSIPSTGSCHWCFLSYIKCLKVLS